MSRIKSLDEDSIHRLCSSQVIVDLTSAVKELVENSLDSGATVIEIKLINYGADSIEVSDNGSGIDPVDYEGLAEKHHTSKLREFEDLEGVTSFGFRGEALNALCELSSGFTVITRRKEDNDATQLFFNNLGKLTQQKKTGRGVGTTVIIDELFASIKVRRLEYVKNIKKQYLKMLKILQAYAIFSVGVKIILSNSMKKDEKRSIIFSTSNNNKIEDNVSTIYGASFLTTLIKCSLELNDEDVQKYYSMLKNEELEEKETKLEEIEDKITTQESQVKEEENKKEISFDMFSSFSSNNDLDDDLLFSSPKKEEKKKKSLTKIAPTSSSSSSSSSSLSTDPSSSSSNPFHLKLYCLISKVSQGVGRSDSDRQFIFVNGRPVDMPRVTKCLNEVWRRYEMKNKPAFIVSLNVTKGNFDINLSPNKREIVLMNEDVLLHYLKEKVNTLYSPSRSTFSINNGVNLSSSLSQANISNFLSQFKVEDDPELDLDLKRNDKKDLNKVEKKKDETQMENEEKKDNVEEVREVKMDEDIENKENDMNLSMENDKETSFSWGHEELALSPLSSPQKRKGIEEDQNESTRKKAKRNEGVELEEVTLEEEGEPQVEVEIKRNDLTWNIDHFDMDFLNYQRIKKREREMREIKKKKELELKQQEYNENEKVEENNNMNLFNTENFKTLTKNSFKQMRVIGQFNLGFIIAEVDGDLFILDQHACDEKYRFELLQKTTKIHQQPLLSPLSLSFSPLLEYIIIENKKVFEFNGFKLSVNEENEVGNRIKVLSIPFSKGIKFGINDIYELASLIGDGEVGEETESGAKNDNKSDKNKSYLQIKNDHLLSSSSTSSNPNHFMLLPKLMSLYASRACRSSVMIGKSLKKTEMVKIVRQMEGVIQPWNCPHGRPTLRHLIDLKKIRK